MESPLRKIAFVVEELGLDTPAQQLLDRFLIGYPTDGDFHRCQCQVSIWLVPGAPYAELRRRLADFPLERHDTIAAACKDADAIVFVPRGVSAVNVLTEVIKCASANAALFVMGALAESLDDAKRIMELCKAGNVMLGAGMPVSVTFRLPNVDIPIGAKVKQALIVVQGESPLAELNTLEAMIPIVERRQNGERGVRRICRLQATDMWSQPDDLLPRRLLAAALSRSDTPQGDAIKDGRTQGLLDLGLVPKLAQNPHGWVLEHTDGLRTTILILDGVVADSNFAVALADETIVSAQLYRPPPPQRHEFSQLAAVVEHYFRTRQPFAPTQRAMLIAGLLGAFKSYAGSGFVNVEGLEGER